MARTKPIPMKAWESVGPYDKPYSRYSCSLLQSPAFTALKAGPRIVYITMLAVAAGHSQFTFPRGVYQPLYGLSHNTVCEAIPRLVEAGFIQLVKRGKNTRTPNVYQFVDTWKKAARPP